MTTSISLPESTTDPTQEPNKVELYAKDAAGVAQLYARSDDGTIHQLTPPGGGLAISKTGVPLPGGPFTVLDFYGGAVDLYDLGGGVAAVEFNEQVFEKFSNGGEGTRFTVNLPGQRANIFYNVQVTMAVNDADTGTTAFKQCRVINDTKTVNDFEVELSAPAEAGDKFYFTVTNRIIPIILPP